MAQYFPAVFPVLLWSTSTALTMFLRLRASSNKIAHMANDLVWDENTCSVFSPLLSFPDTAWHIIGIKSKLLPCPIVYLMYCKHCCSCADVRVCVCPVNGGLLTRHTVTGKAEHIIDQQNGTVDTTLSAKNPRPWLHASAGSYWHGPSRNFYVRLLES